MISNSTRVNNRGGPKGGNAAKGKRANQALVAIVVRGNKHVVSSDKRGFAVLGLFDLSTIINFVFYNA